MFPGGLLAAMHLRMSKEAPHPGVDGVEVFVSAKRLAQRSRLRGQPGM